MKYDYIIVGAGLFGSICAYRLKNMGKKVLVMDKRNHIGGNCFTRRENNIDIHVYGPHIFHTSDKTVWDFVNSITPFDNYILRTKTTYKGKIYSFPINLSTLNQVYGVKTPEEAECRLLSEAIHRPGDNLENHCLSQIGPKLYEMFVKGYIEKQWKRDPKSLPSFIIKRIPVRFDFNDNYYNDIYQGIPKWGYTDIFVKLLDGVEVLLNTDYKIENNICDRLGCKIIYTGELDKLLNYQFGPLDYRSLQFEHKYIETESFQGTPVMNYTELEIPYNRIIEHKYFTNVKTPGTWITKEYPADYSEFSFSSKYVAPPRNEPYYPINDDKNNATYLKYRALIDKNKFIIGGRLGDYKYYDMWQVIKNALEVEL